MRLYSLWPLDGTAQLLVASSCLAVPPGCVPSQPLALTLVQVVHDWQAAVSPTSGHARHLCMLCADCRGIKLRCTRAALKSTPCCSG